MTSNLKTAVVVVEPLMRAEEVARMLNIHISAVYKLPIPTIILSPRRHRWERSAVEAFLESRSKQ